MYKLLPKFLENVVPRMEKSSYRPPLLFSNGHIQTLYPYFFRKIANLKYSRERLITNDNDFIDLDISSVASKELLIISHGLEGSSNSQYVKGMARFFNDRGIDVFAWNMRSCSGELNRQKRFYHAGVTDDLELIIKTAQLRGYKKISLMGFSLGGNLTALYLGQKGKNVASEITSAVVFSTPCDLGTSSDKISLPMHRFYLESFLSTMREKIYQKSKIIDLGIELDGLDKIKHFRDFDDRATAPLHGFKNAQEYYDEASCKSWLSKIVVPTLIVNAKDDPFLTKECFPLREAHRNKNLFLEIPRTGGHVGFVTFRPDRLYWTERRAFDFIKQVS